MQWQVPESEKDKMKTGDVDEDVHKIETLKMSLILQ